MNRLKGKVISMTLMTLRGLVGLVALGGLVGVSLTGCVDSLKDEESPCKCTAEFRYNICVTWDGSATLPESLTFLREQDEGEVDSLAEGMNCFGELRKPQRILVMSHSDLLDTTTVVDSSEWFTPATVDCCHGEARTVEFTK